MLVRFSCIRPNHRVVIIESAHEALWDVKQMFPTLPQWLPYYTSYDVSKETRLWLLLVIVFRRVNNVKASLKHIQICRKVLGNCGMNSLQLVPMRTFFLINKKSAFINLHFETNNVGGLAYLLHTQVECQIEINITSIFRHTVFIFSSSIGTTSLHPDAPKYPDLPYFLQEGVINKNIYVVNSHMNKCQIKLSLRTLPNTGFLKVGYTIES